MARTSRLTRPRLALLLASATAAALCAEPIPLPEILERLSRNETARALELKHYTSIRTYHLYNRRFHKTADMTVKVTYRYPGRKQFEVVSESGPAIVRQKVLRRMLDSEADANRDELRRSNQLTPANYNFKLLRLDQEGGRPAYVLEVIPKTKSQYLIRGEVWVDAEDFAVAKVAGQPAKNPSFLIRDSKLVYRYAKFGSFWLPVSMDSEADALMFGRTEVEIRYKDYQINSEKEASSIAR
jgi:outer membrane lipoprotein-sorting protein